MLNKLKDFLADNGTWRQWLQDFFYAAVLMALLVVAGYIGFLI